MKQKTIKVDYLARVEGEGALWIDIDGENVKQVKLKIFEPPRFFEAFLRGRAYTEAPDITARICGICPVAYQMSAVHALENIIQIKLPNPLRDLRRLLYCGEWIESHGLHIFMLHAPDFLGYPDAIQMAKDHGDIVKMGLQLKKIGNEIVKLVGGREIHPINVKVGGFYKLPKRQELLSLRGPLEGAIGNIQNAMDWVSRLNFFPFKMEYELVSLANDSEYPMNEGRIISNRGLNIDVADFEKHFEEQHVEHSNALHCIHKGYDSYLVGPMARFNLHFSKLSVDLQRMAFNAGLDIPCYNPFQSIVVRLIELAYALHEALRIVDVWQDPGAPAVDINMQPGVGFAATEAPRGLLYHRYEINDQGNIVEARIIPPTSQNQKQIENDLFHFVPTQLNQSDEELTLRCEQAVRNYDPCISCATHFLKMHIRREPVGV